MLGLLAFTPIALVIILMVGFNWGSKKALPVAWVLAALVALTAWKMDLMDVIGYSFYGVLKAFDVIIIYFWSYSHTKHFETVRCYGNNK